MYPKFNNKFQRYKKLEGLWPLLVPLLASSLVKSPIILYTHSTLIFFLFFFITSPIYHMVLFIPFSSLQDV